jgi:hypothetical protein
MSTIFFRSAPVWALTPILMSPIATRPAAAQPVPTLEEIVVTRQKISRSMAEAQSSVFALGANDIVEKELRNIRDTFRLAANVIDSDWVDAGFHIRGVNSEGLTPGGSPLATLYIDGAARLGLVRPGHGGHGRNAGSPTNTISCAANCCTGPRCWTALRSF